MQNKPASEWAIGARAMALPFLFTLTVVFLTKSTLTMLSPKIIRHLIGFSRSLLDLETGLWLVEAKGRLSDLASNWTFGIVRFCLQVSCFEVLFYVATKSLPSAIKLFLRSNFLQTICGRKSSGNKTDNFSIL